MHMQKLIDGIRRFQSEIFRVQRERFEYLASKQQQPIALFITCSDSRVDPNLLTQTEPGELFIMRNAGNIVPPYGAASGGEGATIEYAVEVLGIKNVIVCGHSHCGAMNALLNNTKLKDLPAVAGWISHAEGTRRIMKTKYGHLSGEEKVLVTVKENVLVQLDNLRSHPAVAVGLARGDLHLYGWVYIIETGEMLSYEPEQGCFLRITDNQPKPLVQRRIRNHVS
jgi:carbonic anhydrase